MVESSTIDRVGSLLQNKIYKTMKSNIFNLNWRDLVSAVVSGVLMATSAYISSLADIFTVNFHQLLSIALGTGLVSLMKAFLTTSQGQFVGAIKIK